jgi:hypothetical protein
MLITRVSLGSVAWLDVNVKHDYYLFMMTLAKSISFLFVPTSRETALHG